MGLKKIAKRVHKQFKRDLYHLAEKTTFGAYGGLKKNWEDIRMPLAYAGLAAATALTGGLAAGYTVPAAVGLAAAGAGAGAAAGQQAREGEKAAERLEQENERIAAEEAEQNRRLSLLKAGQTPEAVNTLTLEAKKRLRSQYQKNQVSRQNSNSTIGGSSSTLA